VQRDALVIDPLQSIDNYTTSIHDSQADLVAAEVSFLTALAFQVVCVDCTPLACRAASEAKCKVCIIANFTW
jgi:hypothetical protein